MTTPRLTAERLFSDPPLAGELPSAVQFSPDGRYVSYLRTGEDNRERLDLWLYDPERGESRELLNAKRFGLLGTLSEAEKAERERLRQFSHGITSYRWVPDSAAVVMPVDGRIYRYQLAQDQLEALTDEGLRQTELTVSPGGRYLSYVRAGDLYVLEPATGIERRLTHDASDTVTSGIADFIAQEEMHRFAGHWWTADERMIVYQRTDTAPIPETHRTEIDADSIQMIAQRYPFAGGPNAAVSLHLINVTTGTEQTLAYQDAADNYLARVDVLSEHLAVQVQSRNQQRLRLKLFPRSPEGVGAPLVAIEEQAATWINLHDDLRELADASGLVWKSERNGTAQLFVYRYADGTLQPLMDPVGRVERVDAVDEHFVWFTGWQEEPTEQHLFRLALADRALTRLTTGAGWHDCRVASGERFVALHSALAAPPTLTYHEANQAPATIAGGAIEAPHPYAPYLASHRTPDLGSVQASDGQTLWYRLTLPLEGERPAPLLLYVYGGPGVQLARNEWPTLVRQLFAQHGYAVLELDNRGSANRERTFEAPIYRSLGTVEVEDQLAGIKAVAEHPAIDADRVAVFGHSYGGYMALMCLSKAPDVFKAGVSVAPVSDWHLYDTHYTERYLDTPEANPEGYRSSGVLPHLAGLQGKLLLIHGMADDNVLFTHSTKLYHALQSSHKAFEMMTYPGSKHALQERHVAVHRFELILRFLEASV